MSRIGKSPVTVPDKVKVQVNGATVNVEGPKGKLSMTMNERITASVQGNQLIVARSSDLRQDKALHGLTRSLINNMIVGVTEGYKIALEIQGVGMRAAVQGKILILSLGKSHPINFTIPEGIAIAVRDNVNIDIEGIDKQRVGQVAAKIRAYYPPEPYKGKGVRYAGEQVARKAGKTAQSK